MAQWSCYYFKPAAGNMKLLPEHFKRLLSGLLKLDLGLFSGFDDYVAQILLCLVFCLLRRGTTAFLFNQREI